MKRSLIASFAVLSLLLAACGGGDDADPTDADTEAATDAADTDDPEPSEEEPEGTDEPAAEVDAELTIWTDESRITTIQAIGEEFTADTGVAVEVQQLDFGDIRDELVTAGPAGEGPDIIIGAHDWLGQLVTNGAVAPIDLGERADEFLDVALDAFSYEGQLYGLPYAVENIALFRNTELAPEAPADFDALVESGLALVESGDADLPFALQVGPAGDPYHMYPLLSSYGTGIFGIADDGSYDPDELLLDSEGALAFAQGLADLAEQGVLSADVTFDIALEAFAGGRAPYFLTGPWNVEAVRDAGVEFVVEALPGPGGQTAAPFVGVQGFMISAYAENPLIATDFVVNYLGTQEVARELFETGQRPPALAAVAEEVADDPVIAGFSEVGAAGQPLPNIPAMNVVWEDLGQAQRDILLGVDDPAERMQQAATLIRERIGDA